MNLYHAFILGIVEGLTEFLPVSSTGHLILTSQVLGLSPTEFLRSFEVAIQLGAILAVVALYSRTFLANREVLKRILAAFIPTVVVGGTFYKTIKGVLLANSGVVAWALFLGGVFLIAFERRYQEKNGVKGDLTAVSYRDAVYIGLFQSLAMIPGVSRAAATIVGGLLLGLKRRVIVEFSFLLAVPTMLAACGWDLLQSGQSFVWDGARLSFLAAGFGTSFLVALAGIKFFLRFIQRNNFVAFGIYRILVAVVFWLWVAG